MMSCTRTPSPTRARTRIIYRLSLVLKYIRSRHLDATRQPVPYLSFARLVISSLQVFLFRPRRHSYSLKK